MGDHHQRKGVLQKAHYAMADIEADAVAYARRIEGQLELLCLYIVLFNS